MKLFENNPLALAMYIGKQLEYEISTRVGAECAVTHADAKLLLTIAYEGESNQRDIAERLHVSAPAISRHIKKLEKLDLVRAVAHPTNLRMSIVKLTSRGEKTAIEVERLLEKALGDIATHLPDLHAGTHKDLARLAHALHEKREKKSTN